MVYIITGSFSSSLELYEGHAAPSSFSAYEISENLRWIYAFKVMQAYKERVMFS